MPMARRRRTLFLLAALLAAGSLCAFLIGRYPVSPGEVLGIAFSRWFPIEPFWTERMAIVFVNVRWPRIALSVLVGMSLSAAGAAFQGVFQNPMASPDVLGASSGAGFGAALAIILGLGGAAVSLMAFGMGLLCVGLAMGVARRSGSNPIVGLLLGGIMAGSIFSSATSFLKLIADPTDQLPAITYWLMGSLSGSKLSDLRFFAWPMLAGLAGLLSMSWKLNLLALGDDEARALGTNAPLVRALAVVFATLLTASSVAVSGVIGWVGLVVPHLCRKLVGGEYRYLMPASMLGGGLFLLLVDTVSRTVWTSEVPLGILTAFVGAPFFLWLLMRKEGAE